MKKIAMLLLIMFSITGCGNNSDYTLEITQDNIKETATLTLKDNDYDKANYLNDVFEISTQNYNNEKATGTIIIEKLKTEDLQASYESNKIFEKNIKNNTMTLKVEYNNDDYKDSKIFNSCFNNIYYDSTEEYYVIKGYEGFKCLYKDEIKIVIKTDYKVIDSNADEINKNEYTWYFDEDNYLENELYIQVSKKLKNKISSNWKIYILLGAIIIFVISKILKKGNILTIRKNNEV